MPFTPSQRKHARAMSRDRSKYVNPGIPVALRTTLRLMQRVINGYGRGERRFRHIIERYLEDFARSLNDGMATGYLMGARRAIIHSGIKLQQQNEYDETLRFLHQRLQLTSADMEQVVRFYEPRALRVIDNVTHSVDQALQRTMVRITQEGLHVRQGKARLAQTFDNLGLTPKHRGTLEAIYRTQTQLSYSAGQWAYNQQPEIQEILWGYRYSAVGDERTREEHAMLDGTTLPKDDPRWASIFPPNGWNCRCVAIEIYREVKVQAPPPPKEVDGKIIIPGPDKGFGFNPGEILDAIGEKQAIARTIARVVKPSAVLKPKPLSVIRRKLRPTAIPKTVPRPVLPTRRPTWKPANTSAQARKQLKEVSGARSVVTSTSLDEAAKLRAIEAIGKEYVSIREILPATSNLKFSAVRTTHRIRRKIGKPPRVRDVSGLYDLETKKLEIATRWTKDIVGPAPTGSRTTFRNNSFRTLIRHEMGHGVHDQVLGLTSKAGVEWQLLYESKSVQAWSKQISVYGSTNARELFAESFSYWAERQYTAGTLPWPIEKFMAKHLPRFQRLPG